jgi:hypothetical protein
MTGYKFIAVVRDTSDYTLSRAEFLVVIETKVLRVPPSYSLSPLLTDFTPYTPLSKSGLKLVCNINIVHGNLKSEKSQDYTWKPQRNCAFKNSASGFTLIRGVIFRR